MRKSKILTLMLAFIMLFSTFTPAMGAGAKEFKKGDEISNTITIHKTKYKEESKVVIEGATDNDVYKLYDEDKTLISEHHKEDDGKVRFRGLIPGKYYFTKGQNKVEFTVEKGKTTQIDPTGKVELVLESELENTGSEINLKTNPIEKPNILEPYDATKYGDVSFTLYEVSYQSLLEALPHLLNDTKDSLNSELFPVDRGNNAKLLNALMNIEKNKDDKKVNSYIAEALAYREITEAMANYLEKVAIKGKGIEEEKALLKELEEITIDNKQGIGKFTKLTNKIGEEKFYLIAETKHSNLVTEESKPLLLRLPFLEEDTSVTDRLQFKYLDGDIHLYPKNKAGSILWKIKKHVHHNNSLTDVIYEGKEIKGKKEGAKFNLFKKSAEGTYEPINSADGNPVVLTTGTDKDNMGIIYIENLVVGEYMLVELPVKGAIDGQINAPEEEDYDAELLIKPEYLNNPDTNKIKFKLDQKNGEIKPIDKDTKLRNDGPNGTIENVYRIVNYEKPELDKHILRDKPENGKALEKAKNGEKHKNGILVKDKSGKEEDRHYGFDEEIPYQLTIPVPADIKEYKEFTVEDFNDGLNIDYTSVEVTVKNPLKAPNEVKVKNKELREKGMLRTNDDKGLAGKFTKDKQEVDGIGFGIDFYDTNSKAQKYEGLLDVGSQIFITYKAKINTTKVVTDTIKNTATLIYNNGTGQRKDKDDEKVETYGKSFVKTDTGIFGSDLAKQGLAGAKFVVKNEEGKYLAVKENPVTKQKEYTWVDNKDDKDVHTLVSSDKPVTKTVNGKEVTYKKGYFEIFGLKEGKYYLVETKAPDGYRPLDEPVGFTINSTSYFKNNEDGSIDKKSLIAPQEVENTKGPDKPFTGYEKATITSLVLIFAMAAAFVIRRKFSKDTLK